MGKAVRWDVRDGASGREARDWVRAHTALTRLARDRAAADAEEGRCLLVAWRAGVHVFLGYGSFSEYVDRLLGYSPRTTREKLRVAEALERLPLSARALEQAKLTWCAARELTRVATAETEPAWLELAHGKTTRELEQLVAGRRPGDLPPAAADAQPPRRHVLRFEVAPETFATFRQATLSLRQAAGGVLDDDTLLLMMARQVLGTPADVGRSSYRIAYELCPACGQGGQVVGGKLIAVGADVLDMAACDGEHVGLHEVRPANENHSVAHENGSEACEPASPAAHVGHAPPDDTPNALPANPVETAAPVRCPAMVAATSQAPRAGQRLAPVVIRAIDEAAEPVAMAAHVDSVPFDDPSDPVASSAVESVVRLESAANMTIAPKAPRARQVMPSAGIRAVHEVAEPAPPAAHVGQAGHAPHDDTARPLPATPIESAAAVPRQRALETASKVPRARQAVPPAVRRAVLARDRQRCQVPGCTHTHFVDVHHVRPRSEGGRNTACNLVTLCTAHHRSAHRGELIIEGSAARLVFRHADGTPYGQLVAAQPVDAYAKVFAALRHLGFREREVHAVLAELRHEGPMREATANVLLREALCRIRPGR